jgi:hypothetical protein
MQIATAMKGAMERLQVWEAFLAGLQVAQSYADIQALVGRTKEQAKANRNRLALVAHPDRGGSLEAMQELNAAYEVIEGLTFRRAPRVRVVQVEVRMSGGWHPYSTTSTTSGAGYW